MKKVLFLFLVLISFRDSFGQSLKKYPIGNSGCAAYFYADPGEFAISYSEDSSIVYTGESVGGETNYGVICVKLKESVADIGDAETLMVSYLDYLKTSFKITSSAGYGKGHRLKDHEDTRGIIDYWTDSDKFNWKIKSWTDRKFIVVLYVYTKSELQETKADVFLNSLVLP